MRKSSGREESASLGGDEEPVFDYGTQLELDGELSSRGTEPPLPSARRYETLQRCTLRLVDTPGSSTPMWITSL